MAIMVASETVAAIRFGGPIFLLLHFCSASSGNFRNFGGNRFFRGDRAFMLQIWVEAKAARFSDI